MLPFPVASFSLRPGAICVALSCGLAAAWLARPPSTLAAALRPQASTAALRPQAFAAALRPQAFAATLRPRAPTAALRPQACMAAPLTAIEQRERFHYRIVRSAFRRLSDCEERASPFSGGARIVPSIRDHVPNGIRLYAVRPCSVIAMLGFENGDLVERVNGVPLTSPDRLLHLYSRLPEARRVRVDLTRRGNPVQIVYQIVD
jgi:hypothetical protein